MKPGVAARVAAARSLGRVLRAGAWSNRILDSEGGRLDADDRRVARRLLYGTIRSLSRIDAQLTPHLRRGLDRTDDEVLDVLRIGGYELTVGDGAHHAAVDSAVEAVRELGHGRAAGFVNGVLRNVIRAGRPDDAGETLAERHSVPEWYVDDLCETLGSSGAASYLSASDRDAPRTARVRPGTPTPPGAVPTALDDVVVLAEGPVPDGLVIQDVASAAVGRALGGVGGLRVLDVAAAPGGKTLQLWDEGPELMVAMDLHGRRLERARKRTEAGGYGGFWVHADGARLPFGAGTFDRVLVDAPCTGMGTLRRRPELRLRVRPAEVERLAGVQRALLAEARRVLAPRGRIVYSVCTTTRRETVDMAAEFGGRAPEGALGVVLDHGRMLAPHLDGTDGMFIAVMDGS